MNDPPDPAVRWRGVERLEVERLVHARVGEPPDERSRREIGGHDDDGVGERGRDQMERVRKIRGRSDPPRRGPGNARDKRRDGREQDAGPGAAHRPHARKLRSPAWPQGPFRKMPDGLAAKRISRLNAKRVERPEIGFRNAKQWTPAEPACGDDAEQQKRGAESVQFQEREKTPPTHAVAMSGASPRIAAGSTIDAIHASRSFVRLISARRLPAMARSDFCFGLETSSSASPSRGSRIGRPGSRRSSPGFALEGKRSGARMASVEDFPTASSP